MENYLKTGNGDLQVKHANRMFSALCDENSKHVDVGCMRLINVNIRGAVIAVDVTAISSICFTCLHEYDFIIAYIDNEMFEEVIIELLYVG